MNSKKSMHIFLVTLFLLIISGCIIIGFLYLQDRQMNGRETVKNPSSAQSVRVEEYDAQNHAAAFSKTGTVTLNDSPPLRQTSGPAGTVQYQVVVEDGYLNVYYYQTNELFFHTGIAMDTLDEAVRDELLHGKFFEDEQGLYGYLESCTS